MSHKQPVQVSNNGALNGYSPAVQRPLARLHLIRFDSGSPNPRPYASTAFSLTTRPYQRPPCLTIRRWVAYSTWIKPKRFAWPWLHSKLFIGDQAK